MQELNGKHIALIATNGVEESEFSTPLNAVRAAGATVDVIALSMDPIQAMQHNEKGATFAPDSTIDQVNADAYDGLLLPGGVANPDALRVNEKVVAFVTEMARAGKPIAAICHGPWLLVEADVVRGREVTSWPSLRTDIRNAGGRWVDREVVADQGIVTSRKPDDLDAFCAKVIEEFAEGAHRRQFAGSSAQK